MKMTVYAGVVALAALGFLFNVPAGHASGARTEPAVLSQATASINIGRIKSVLRLTPEQERYWIPVEAALRDLARRQAGDEQAGFVRRFSRRMVSVVLDGAAIHRLEAAVRPLIAVLDNDQRRAATGLAQEMGLGPVVAALI